MTQKPKRPSAVPDYPPAPSGSQVMPYRRDGTLLRPEDNLLDLCRRAVEAKLLYSCGQTMPYSTLDHIKSNDTTTVFKPTPPKSWFVKVKPEEGEQYFTADDLRKYLTDLFTSHNL